MVEPEIRCRFSWQRKQIESFIHGYEARVPYLKLDPKLTPKEMIDAAVTYGIWVEAKYPELQGKLTYREQPLKMSFYNARKANEQCFRPTPNILYAHSGKPLHKCALDGGTEHTGGLDRDSAGIPHILGELSAWKTWQWNEQAGKLCSPSHRNFIWEPLQIVEAKCDKCPAPPCTRCTCGIYAGTEAQASTYGEVLGLLKQWGRFVQGTTGVKSQFAYPLEFHLQAGQEPLIEQLQQYGVPIKMMMPTVVWDPREAGFTQPFNSTQEGETL